MRYTERRPDLYEECPNIKPVETVLHIVDTPTKDGAVVLKFGQKEPGHQEQPANINEPDWLWQYQGQLKVIATKFYKGVHYATLPEHYLPIVAHLKELHTGGFVHGDIRAFNMVLDYDDKDENNNYTGHLIDFDFGGEINENYVPQMTDNGYINPVYPSGYRHHLEDGFRLDLPGGQITESPDWYALSTIIFDLYKLTHEDFDEEDIINNERELTPKEQMISDQKSRLESMQAVFTAKAGDYRTLKKSPSKFFEEYLKLATNIGFELKLTLKFSDSLKKCNFLPHPGPRIDSKGATGSPPKKKKGE